MLERDPGVIVNVSSFGGRAGIVKEAAYCASKFALCGWSEAMAMDLFHTGVDVRLILPGAIATEIWDQPGNDDPVYDGPFEPPETVAAGIIDAIEGDAFELYVPDMRPHRRVEDRRRLRRLHGRRRRLRRRAAAQGRDLGGLRRRAGRGRCRA